MAAKRRYQIMYVDIETDSPTLTSHAPTLKAARTFAVAHITSEYFRYGISLKAVITNDLRPNDPAVEISVNELPIKTTDNAKDQS